MSKYLSAEKLDIRKAVHKGLQLTLKALEGGKLKHRKALKELEFGQRTISVKRWFNMNYWSVPHQCGTAMCLGGWTEHFAHLPVNSIDTHMSGKLYELFYPNELEHWEKITPKQAARALRSYLEMGDARWAKAAPRLKQRNPSPFPGSLHTAEVDHSN